MPDDDDDDDEMNRCKRDKGSSIYADERERERERII